MNFQFSQLVSQIIKGLKSYFEKNEIKVNENFYEELMNILNIELSKPFNKQIFTPTQILNDYILLLLCHWCEELTNEFVSHLTLPKKIK